MTGLLRCCLTVNWPFSFHQSGIVSFLLPQPISRWVEDADRLKHWAVEVRQPSVQYVTVHPSRRGEGMCLFCKRVGIIRPFMTAYPERLLPSTLLSMWNSRRLVGCFPCRRRMFPQGCLCAVCFKGLLVPHKCGSKFAFVSKPLGFWLALQILHLYHKCCFLTVHIHHYALLKCPLVVTFHAVLFLVFNSQHLTLSKKHIPVRLSSTELVFIWIFVCFLFRRTTTPA